MILAHPVNIFLSVFGVQCCQENLAAVESQHGDTELKQRTAWIAVGGRFAVQCHGQNVKGVFDFPALVVEVGQLARIRVGFRDVTEEVDFRAAVSRRFKQFDRDATDHESVSRLACAGVFRGTVQGR